MPSLWTKVFLLVLFLYQKFIQVTNQPFHSLIRSSLQQEHLVSQYPPPSNINIGFWYQVLQFAPLHLPLHLHLYTISPLPA
ncbi:hypothetical protein BDP27DRAFT_1325144 [Rhodocollybia butyracea]|uniref:Secreted protein n=1 Tax=Rhodocollybia butyracea TaxID=206335 RepID=A0A9P5PUP9_9AGAR|nr:hypothetical protein BDP27DRAFT_1325144 [Rhodocollybia butyracea]